MINPQLKITNALELRFHSFHTYCFDCFPQSVTAGWGFCLVRTLQD